MNRIIIQLVAVGFCFAVVQALQCYKCTFGVGQLCVTSKITCASGELCFSGVGEAVGLVSVKTKGCLEEAKCNKTSDETLFANTTVYKITKTCCSGDLCNAAPATSGLSMALASIAALFVANTLV